MSEPTQLKQVTASDVGQAAYCPYQLYLRAQGVQPDHAARVAIRRGHLGHDAWAQQRRQAGRRAPSVLRVLATTALLAALLLVLFLVLQRLRNG